MAQTIVTSIDSDTGVEVARVETDGVVLVCHHPREGIWCCCADDGHAMCCCAPDLQGAVRAWYRNDHLGE